MSSALTWDLFLNSLAKSLLCGRSVMSCKDRDTVLGLQV